MNQQQSKVGLLVALQSAFSVSCLYALLVVMLHGRLCSRKGTRKVWKALCPLLFLSVEGLNGVFCNWLVILWSSCALAWVGLVESSAGVFYSLNGQPKQMISVKESHHIFQVLVLPYVTLLIEHQSCQCFLLGSVCMLNHSFNFICLQK